MNEAPKVNWLSRQNVGARYGSNNGFWKGGTTISSNGYRLMRVGLTHKLSDTRGYAYEHRIVASEKIGRSLRRTEIVHHLDGNKLNNDPNNLAVCESVAQHKANHRGNPKLRQYNEPNILIFCECGCGRTLLKYDAHGRPRRAIFGHNVFKGTGKKNTVESIQCKCGCGENINKYDRFGRERFFVSGHNGRVKK